MRYKKVECFQFKNNYLNITYKYEILSVYCLLYYFMATVLD